VNGNDQEQALLGPVEWVDALPSTNSELLQRIAGGEAPPPGHVLAVRHQTAGRGRQQRVWQSGAGRDLAFSFLWPPEPPERIVSLPMAVALAVVDLLQAHRIQAATKWPNDVLADEKKICGLLAETATDGAGREVGVVVGVGLNVNMSAAEAAAIDRPATSMQVLAGHSYSVSGILDALLPLLNARLVQWRAGGFTAIRSDWQASAAWLDRSVELQTDTGCLTGILRGYGDSGELLLEAEGSVREVWSAELMRCVG
jgi:BirA family biotin operon repressor/biotin-[acetyl-CoA-carboxylase] ligase